MDPRKTREPVTGHPDTDLNAALDSIMLSPPQSQSNSGYESNTSDASMASMVTVVSPSTAEPPLPAPELLTPDQLLARRESQAIGTLRNAIQTLIDLQARTRLSRYLSVLAEELVIADKDTLLLSWLPMPPTTTEGSTQTANSPMRSYAEAAKAALPPPARRATTP